MNYDAVFNRIDSFGPYQRKIFILLSLPVLSTAVQTCLPIFILYIPEHSCHLDNSSHAIYFLNDTLPEDSYAPLYVDKTIHKSECEVSYRYSNNTTEKLSAKCTKWDFEQSEFENTFVTQENLVCDKKLYRTHATTVYLVGFTIGSIILGVISDKYGRRKSFLLSSVIHAISTIVLTWIPSFEMFLVLRFFAGVSVGGLLTTTYVMVLEFVGPKSRVKAGIEYMLYWGGGMILLAGAAYYVRDWRYLNAIMAIPTVLFLSYYRLVPESPRWLFVRRRYEEAERILQRIARKNNQPCENTIFEIQDNLEIEEPNNDVVAANRLCFSNFCDYEKLGLYAVICLNWAAVACVFSGLSLNVSNLGGDVYFNFLLISVAEIIGFLVCIPLLRSVGRIKVYIITLLFGGVALITTVVPILYGSENLRMNMTVFLSLLGKVGSSAAFATLFLYSAEFVPTKIRNSSLGFANICARLAGTFAPYIVDLGMVVGGGFGQVLPMLVFGILAVIASLLACILPGKNNDRLPD